MILFCFYFALKFGANLGGRCLDDAFFRRRQRMVRLFAIGNGLKVVVETISKEFDIPKKTVYSDHSRMNEWVHDLQQDKQLSSLVRERLDLLNRELLGLMLEIDSVGEKKASVKERFLKVNAAIAALKVVQEQIKLGQNLGLIERKPEEVITYGSIGMPFACDPEIKKALVAETERQAEQRKLENERRVTVDAQK